MDTPRRNLRLALALLLAITATSRARGEERTALKLLSGLSNPTGVAIRPGSAAASADKQPEQAPAPYDVVVSDSGAGRIISVRSDQPDRSTELITGFPKLAPSEGSPAAVEPDAMAGMFFLDHHRVVVGLANVNKPALRLYHVGDDALPVSADSLIQSVQLPRDENSSRATAGSYSLARTFANDRVADMLILSRSRAENASGLWKVLIRADTLDKASLMEQVEGESPARLHSATLSPTGFIVAVETSEGDKQHHVVFVNPIDAKPVMRVPLEITGTVALAYSPRTKNLYAAVADVTERSPSGIYRLDESGAAGESAVSSVKIAEVDRPITLTFGPDGALYVTARGDVAGRNGERGQLLKITGEF